MDFQQLQFPDIDVVHQESPAPPVPTEHGYQDIVHDFRDDDNESVSSAHSVRNCLSST